MLASALDEVGLRAPCGADRPRGRRGFYRYLRALLGRVVERQADLDRARGVGARRACRVSGLARLPAAGVVARGMGGAGAPGGVRRLVRAVGSVVDRARSVVGLPEPRARVPGGGRE